MNLYGSYGNIVQEVSIAISDTTRIDTTGITWLNTNDWIPKLNNSEYMQLIVQIVYYDFLNDKEIYVQNLFEFGSNEISFNMVQRIEGYSTNASKTVVLGILISLTLIWIQWVFRFFLENTTVLNLQGLMMDFLFVALYGFFLGCSGTILTVPGPNSGDLFTLDDSRWIAFCRWKSLQKISYFIQIFTYPGKIIKSIAYYQKLHPLIKIVFIVFRVLLSTIMFWFFMFMVVLCIIIGPYIVLNRSNDSFSDYSLSLFTFITGSYNVEYLQWNSKLIYCAEAFYMRNVANFIYIIIAAIIIVTVKKAMDIEIDQNSLHESIIDNSISEITIKNQKLIIDLQSHFKKTKGTSDKEGNEDHLVDINLIWVDEELKNTKTSYEDQELLEYFEEVSNIRIFPQTSIDEVLRFLESLFRLKLKLRNWKYISTYRIVIKSNIKEVNQLLSLESLVSWLTKNDIMIPIGYYCSSDNQPQNPQFQTYQKKLYTLIVFFKNHNGLKAFCSKNFYMSNGAGGDNKEEEIYDDDNYVDKTLGEGSDIA